MKYYTYVIKSTNKMILYKGMTSDIEVRLQAHNAGKVRATKAYRPWTVVYFEEHETIEAARKRELYLKSGQGRDFLQSLNL